MTAPWEIRQGSALELLRAMPEASVQTCVTSPPYFGLRDYGTGSWDGGDPDCKHAGRPKPRQDTHGQRDENHGRFAETRGTQPAKAIHSIPVRDVCRCGARRIDQQIGLERQPSEYVERLVEVLQEVRRVLREDGTLWLNLGDSYCAAPPGNAPRDLSRGRPKGTRGQQPSKAARFVKSDRSFEDLKPKDLIGMPWRVAFALQAPRYTGRIPSERDRAWLAALVDGEGCITILQTTSPHGSGDSFPPVLQVRMCDAGPIEHAAAISGWGVASPRQDPPSTGGNHGSYQWRLSGRKAADTIAEVYPYLLAKRAQAIIAWNHQRVRESYHVKRGVPIPQAALEKAIACRELIRRANKRLPVDVPSWMEAPPSLHRPGWYLRSDCIWAKPNPMPESVTDRPTKAHEYVFLLTKGERYYYDATAVEEPSTDRAPGNVQPTTFARVDPVKGRTRANLHNIEARPTRNRRTVWTIPTQPFAEAHFATFPEALVEPCVLAGSSTRACEVCGAPWLRHVEREATDYGRGDLETAGHKAARTPYPDGKGQATQRRRTPSGTTLQKSTGQTVGLGPGCECKAQGTGRCVVLDPFAGSGTVGVVALRHGRRFLGLELNPEYAAMARRRIAGPLFAEGGA